MGQGRDTLRSISDPVYPRTPFAFVHCALMCSWQRSVDSNLESANWRTAQDCSVTDSVVNFHIFLQLFSNRLFF